MGTGELIRKYRKMRGLTQSELAKKCGLTDSAIRNYELGNRTPGEDQVKGIASALHVAPESLFDVPAATAREALELIFRIDEEFGLKPKEIGGEVVLAIDPSSKKAPKLAQALKAWLAQIDSNHSQTARQSPKHSSRVVWRLSLFRQTVAWSSRDATNPESIE